MPVDPSTTESARLASSFTIIKGALIEESYVFLEKRDRYAPKAENIERFQREEWLGRLSPARYRDLAWVMNRRFDPRSRDLTLAILAQWGLPIDEWRPILLWHITRNEFLLRDFLTNWLYPAYFRGKPQLRARDLYAHLESVEERGGILENRWTRSTLERVASSLLRMAVDFRLLKGKGIKEFASIALPERSQLCLLHAIRETVKTDNQVVTSPDWRLFLRTPADLHEDLRRLASAGRITYQPKDGRWKLSLAYSNPLDYIIDVWKC